MLFYVDIYIFYQFQMPYLKGTYFGSLFLKQPWLNLGLLVYNWNSGLITCVTMKSTAGPLLKLQKGTNILYDLKFGILELCRILEKIVYATFIVNQILDFPVTGS